MADFCSLCGYIDIDIHQIYNEHVKPHVADKKLDNLQDGKQMIMGGFFICEGCGLISVGFDNKYNVYGIYWVDGETTEKFKIGYVDKVTLEFIFDEEHPLYKEKRKRVKEEDEAFIEHWRTHFKELKDIAYKLYCEKEGDSLSYDDFDITDEKYLEYEERASDMIYERNHGDSK